ncbi:helix-turn-helix domain-containing protein [Cyanobium sp. CH-040]|uniref:helix-turn-helix domain-containing protein n=1 Tax=Cyanobium sp. CH-040 TaxID=2823708 RepID=UPI0020CD4A2A|nr:helix-turn-helix domain-containing protein [Cyanobium sp. CH-040]MCP9926314.1 helix-turn-helix domain-containing protein [Cyanobium sp. CH-040]
MDCTIGPITAGRAHLESPRSITLCAHQSLLLAQVARDAECLRLTVHGGIGRIAASFSQPGCRNWNDVTLAFAAREERPWLRLPASTSCLLEALTPLRCDMQPLPQCPASHDLISDWLLELHLVRHPVGADLRLRALLQLLVQRFGRRSGAGYHLPLALGHARLAELIGSTRSTVTRQISELRRQNLLRPGAGGGALLLAPELVEGP